MNSTVPNPNPTIPHELAPMREHWFWFLILGIALLALGLIAVGSGVATFYVTAITVVLFGFIMLVGGVAQVVSSFWAGKWSGFLVHLLVGILYVVVGYLIVDQPDVAIAVLTLLLAAFLIIAGVFRIVAALVVRFHDWGWVMLSGIISVILGVMINEGWPATSLFVIGLFIGIELIFNGWSWIMFAYDLRNCEISEEAGSGG